MEFLLDYDKRYWDNLMALIGNEYGVAALMGNLEDESNCIPYRLQADYLVDGQYKGSIAYTNAVDNGTYSKDSFIHDSKGYGVAQWTFYTRKEMLYSLHQSTGLSIGSFELSMEMMRQELLGSYLHVYNVLKNATDIRFASDYVLHNYEQPGDQSVEVEEERAGFAQEFYNRFSGSKPSPEPGTGTSMKKIYLYLRRRES